MNEISRTDLWNIASTVHASLSLYKQYGTRYAEPILNGLMNELGETFGLEDRVESGPGLEAEAAEGTPSAVGSEPPVLQGYDDQGTYLPL